MTLLLIVFSVLAGLRLKAWQTTSGPIIPEEMISDYWKKNANYHFIDAQLQQTLKSASELTMKRESARLTVEVAKERLNEACGSGNQLDPVKFEKGDLACIPNPPAVKP